MKIVITSPSLDERENVSGISTIVRQIIEHGSDNFVHFRAGRQDGEPAGMRWMVRQAILPVKFYLMLRKVKPDLVHINTALTDLSIWRDAALTKAASFAGVPVLLAVHGGKFLLNEIEDGRLKAAAGSMLNAARSVVVYSEGERRQLESRWKSLEIRILANAVPLRQDSANKTDNPAPILIFLGRLHRSKGLAELTKACRALKNDGFVFRLHCFGDGPMKDEFAAEMEDILGDGFYFGGVVSGTPKLEELDRADIFVLPSIYGEGLPMAILEAMSAGCVVIASEMASVAEVIRDGSNGYLIEPGNTPQLISRLKLVLGSRSDWKPIQEAAKRTVRERFAITRYIENLETIYRSIVT
ncbi:MAG: glycosyltransferase family 4 protein [Pyrinomonadaceae bacterium]